jgi:hypothetical protein
MISFLGMDGAIPGVLQHLGGRQWRDFCLANQLQLATEQPFSKVDHPVTAAALAVFRVLMAACCAQPMVLRQCTATGRCQLLAGRQPLLATAGTT